MTARDLSIVTLGAVIDLPTRETGGFCGPDVSCQMAVVRCLMDLAN